MQVNPHKKSQTVHRLLSSAVVARVLPDVMTDHAEHQRVSARLHQTDEDLEQLIVHLVQTVAILAPELLALVHWRPLQSTRFDFRTVLFERAEKLQGFLECVFCKLIPFIQFICKFWST